MTAHRLLLAGLTILIAVIAHDLLMALDDHVASAAGGDAGQRHTAWHEAAGHEPHAVSLSAHDPVTCFVSQPATLPSMSGINLPVAILPASWLPVGATTSVTPTRSAPGHPPAVLRALLQVYRN
jgi:hypothetical protein